MNKGCLGCLGPAVALVLGAFIFIVFLAGREWQTTAVKPMEYALLDEYEEKDVPPFASNIYKATWTHWQVGEWAWRFDVPPDSEEELKLWLAGIGGQPRAANQCGVLDMAPPSWWARPEDARLVSNRDMERGVRMSMWFSPSQCRVWILYEQ